VPALHVAHARHPVTVSGSISEGVLS
jgi:hypothetical protein